MDLLCGDLSCCKKCTKSASFHHVVDLESEGLAILKYVADIFQKEFSKKNLPTLTNVHDHHGTNNIFVIINTDPESAKIYNEVQPKFDINQMSCLRCRYRAEKALKLLKNKADFRIENVIGICEHCKAQQTSQKPCAICEETVKKFLEETDVQNKSELTWYKQHVPHIHRSLSTDRGKKSINLDKFDMTRPKSKTSSILDLNLAAKSKIELYKPLLVPPKRRSVLKKSKIDRSSRKPLKIKEFLSDDSIITSFITSLSKGEERRKDKSFKYVFPSDAKPEILESKALKITSSELIEMTRDKLDKKNQTQEGKREEEYYDEVADMVTVKTKYEVTKEKTSEMLKVKLERSVELKLPYSEDQLRKDKVKPQSSEVRPTRSEIQRDDKDVRAQESKIKSDKIAFPDVKKSLEMSKMTSKSQIKKGVSEDVRSKSPNVEIKKSLEEGNKSKGDKYEESLGDGKIRADQITKRAATQEIKSKTSVEKSQLKEAKKSEYKLPATPKSKETKKIEDKPPATPQSKEAIKLREKVPAGPQSKETKRTEKMPSGPPQLKEAKRIEEKSPEKPQLQDVKKSEEKPPKTKEAKNIDEKSSAKPQPKEAKKIEKMPSGPPQPKEAKTIKVKPLDNLTSQEVNKSEEKPSAKLQSKEIKKIEEKPSVKPQSKDKKNIEEKPQPKETKRIEKMPSGPPQPKETKRIEKMPSGPPQPKEAKTIEEKPPDKSISQKVKQSEEKPLAKPQSKETKKEKSPAKPPKSIKDIEKDGEKQEDQSKQKAKRETGGRQLKLDKNQLPAFLQDQYKKKDLTDEKKLKSKDMKEAEEETKTKDKTVKKDVKLLAAVKKTKTDEQKVPIKEKDDEKVLMKNRASQVKDADTRRKERQKEASQKPPSPQKLQEQQAKSQDSKLKDLNKDEKQEIKKEKPKKSKSVEKENKDAEKPMAELEMPKKQNLDFDIMKFLPSPKEPPKITTVQDKQQAQKMAEQRMKDFLAFSLTDKIETSKKGVVMSELPKGEHFLFKIKARGRPEMTEDIKRTLKDMHLSHIQMKTMKMRGPSYDNLVLKMIKMGQQGIKTRSTKIQRRRKDKGGQYKIRSAKRTTSLWSLTIDSDVELEIDRLARLVTIQEIRHRVQGTHIVRNVPEKKKTKLQPDPLLFYKEDEEDSFIEVHDIEEEPKKVVQNAGIFRYMLSDPYYIYKGWTVLPTLKVVRKMNIYKLRPAHPEFDWFNCNKKKGMLRYETGEILADFEDNGRGRWFYKNGQIALDYYDSEDTHAQQRFVLYSSGEHDEHCKSLIAILAVFDYEGNGVVFDHSGKIRIKYNQTEGVLLDKRVGPVTRWKWHTLNDPPVLKKVMIDTLKTPPDPKILRMEDDHRNKKIYDEEMLAIEFNNVITDKTQKQTKAFQPFQIRMKALKINKQFTLKILDQAHVYLYFRDGTTNMKLNLGMLLDHNEIIDTDETDVGEVSNVIERLPAETESVVNLQERLKQIRRCDRERTEHEMKVRRILPVSSADQKIRALSKPLRPPPAIACEHDEVAYSQRKSSPLNMYYNTRLI